MTLDFTNKVALVTGAASGIGRATALAFAASGAAIVVTDINVAGGEETVAAIEDNGGQAHFIQHDVGEEGRAEAVVTEAVERFGRIDYGINNAGVPGSWARIPDVAVDDYRQVMRINVDGVFFGMQAQLPAILANGEDGGAIVNVSSIAGVRALKNSAPYVASKHAVIGLTKTAAVEYARKNIRVNAICPVFTRTPLFETMLSIDESYEEKLLRSIPMKRFGTTDDIANAILWLCAAESGFVTGQTLLVDGGLTA